MTAQAMFVVNTEALRRKFAIEAWPTYLRHKDFPDEETWDLYLRLNATVQAWRSQWIMPMLVDRLPAASTYEVARSNRMGPVRRTRA